MNPTVRDNPSVFVSFVTIFQEHPWAFGQTESRLNESESGDTDTQSTPQSSETLPYSLPIQKTPVVIVGALFRERVALKNSVLKTHTKSTAEALRTRSSPAPPCCCCGCPPPRPAPVDSSWSNLEKLVSYSLCARGKRPPRWRVSHSFVRRSIHSLARSTSSSAAAAMGRARFVILRARWLALAPTERKIPPPVSTTSERASTPHRRDKTRRIDEENYFQRIRVFPTLDRSSDGAFRPRRSSAKRDREEEEKASRETHRG